MDERLVEAARVGDVNTLHRIMEEDPEILEKESLGHSSDSALHIAARRGKAEFVKEILSLMPSLATATNQKGLIPLHMASAQGHVETVKELLKAKLHDEHDGLMTMKQCLVKDDNGWNPLHYAVFRGRLEVIKELMRHSPECVEEVTAKRETVLHLAVKANQLKVVEMILERIQSLPNLQTLFEAKDINGNTVYDLAPAKKHFLVRLEKGKEEEKEGIEEETSITLKVEDGSNDDDDEAPENNKQSNDDDDEAPENNKQKKEVASAEFQNILVVATLIITLSYQGLTNPPPTVFPAGGSKIDWSCVSPNYFSPKYLLFPSIKIDKSCPAYLAVLFLVVNTMIFIQSIFLLLSSLHGAGGFFLILRFLALFLTYNYCVLLEAFTFYAGYFTAAIYWLSTVFLLYLLYNEPRIKRKLWRIWRNRRHCVSRLTK